MAKWGEGDPRWIVEERADATNVNNWHWTEKNATNWSKDLLKALLIGMKIEGAAGCVTLDEFSTLDGEASANNRKSKLIFFYEWDIKIKWKGIVNSEAMDKLTGTIGIPNLSDEQDITDIQVNITVKEDKPGAVALKEMLRTKGADLIREKLASYVDKLKSEFARGMILPSAGSNSNLQNMPKQEADTNNLTDEFKDASLNTKDTSTAAGVKISTKKISMKENFMCSQEELYRALTERNMVQAFTRAPMSAWELEVGGKFSLFDGLITGEFQQLVPNEMIVMRWRMRDWLASHYSTVTLKLEQTATCCSLTLSQTGVPATEAERTKNGWNNYYWNSIRQTFGYAVDINF